MSDSTASALRNFRVMARHRKLRLILVALVLFGVSSPGCVPSHRPPGELEAPHAAEDLGVKVVTHEQARAEMEQMLKVFTDFVPAQLDEVKYEYKQQCIVGNTDVSNGALDYSERWGSAVDNYVQYSHDFVDHAKALGFRTESIWSSKPHKETWFSYRDNTGASIGVDLYPDHTIVSLYSRCYEYDWPELTPTPTPSVTPDG